MTNELLNAMKSIRQALLNAKSGKTPLNGNQKRMLVEIYRELKHNVDLIN